MTNKNTSTTIYVVSYGEYKIPDKEYADGFRWAWCDGIAVGAYTDRAVAEAVAMASERGHLTSVTLNEVSENYRHILEGMGRDQPLPARNQTAENPLAAFMSDAKTAEDIAVLEWMEKLATALGQAIMNTEHIDKNKVLEGEQPSDDDFEEGLKAFDALSLTIKEAISRLEVITNRQEQIVQRQGEIWAAMQAFPAKNP